MIDDRDEEEFHKSREEEAGDDGAAETLPDRVGESDRDESDDGRHRGQEYRFETASRTVRDGLVDFHASFEILVYLVHHDDGIIYDDAEECEHADERREGEWNLCDGEEKEDAGNREWDDEEDDHRLSV